MLEKINVLIATIQAYYLICNDSWHKEYPESSFNMSKYEVKDIPKMSSLLSYIYLYRTFLLNNSIDSELKKLFLDNLDLKEANLSVRIKNDNSLQDKIDRYNREEHHNYGKNPINKCLNDILGIRIIVEEDIDYEALKLYLKEKYNDIRTTVSNPTGSNYIAVHVYFGRGDNTNFRWELQIWDNKHAKANEESHRIYKQNYKVWESNIQKEEII